MVSWVDCCRRTNSGVIMPFKSAKQKRAMHAAAAGKSKIGISKKGAKKFIAHSKKSKRRSSGRKRSRR